MKTEKSKRREMLATVIIGSIVCISFLGLALQRFMTQNRMILNSDLITLKSVLTNKAEITNGAVHQPAYIQVRLSAYPDFKFKIDFPGFDVTHRKEYISEVKKDDIIEIDILKSDYDKKIASTRSNMPLDYVNYHQIEIYALRKDTIDYLTLEDYNYNYQQDAKSGWFIYILMGLCFGAIGYYSKWKYYKDVNNKG